ARRPVLEDRRREDHRRPLPQRRRLGLAQIRGPTGQAPVRLCLSLCVRDAARRGQFPRLRHLCVGSLILPQIPFILSLVTFLPLVGAGLILLARLVGKGDGAAAARWIALITTLAVLAVSAVLVMQFNPQLAPYQFVERFAWFA